MVTWEQILNNALLFGLALLGTYNAWKQKQASADRTALSAKLDTVHDLVNGASIKLEAVAKASGYADGVADTKAADALK
jgi:hypothetical protein